ncbi:hypothetical protein PMAN_b0306 [Pseudoalteromonas marina]|nr:hypothetical protein PMAN_b0306 [Pseudoalteromonas marina]
MTSGAAKKTLKAVFFMSQILIIGHLNRSTIFTGFLIKQ